MSRNRIIFVLILAFLQILDAKPRRFLMKANSGKTYLGVGTANKEKAESLNRQMVNHQPCGSIRGRWCKNNWGLSLFGNIGNTGNSQGQDRVSYNNLNRQSYDIYGSYDSNTGKNKNKNKNKNKYKNKNKNKDKNKNKNKNHHNNNTYYLSP